MDLYTLEVERALKRYREEQFSRAFKKVVDTGQQDQLSQAVNGTTEVIAIGMALDLDYELLEGLVEYGKKHRAKPEKLPSNKKAMRYAVQSRIGPIGCYTETLREDVSGIKKYFDALTNSNKHPVMVKARAIKDLLFSDKKEFVDAFDKGTKAVASYSELCSKVLDEYLRLRLEEVEE